jgi:hypothetical protein
MHRLNIGWKHYPTDLPEQEFEQDWQELRLETLVTANLCEKASKSFELTMDLGIGSI